MATYIVEQKLHGEWEHSGQIAVDRETGVEIAFQMRCAADRVIRDQKSKAMQDWMRDHLPADYRVVKAR